jgi:hypothetical protein
MKEKFPNFLEKAEKLKGKSVEEFNREDWIELICKDCQFYHEEEGEKLECAAFKILRELIKGGVFSLNEACQKLKK